jgi:predicted nucleotidyltransferase component of viral defense system
MLSYDALIEQAGRRGMPAQKLRGIVREYLQILILHALSRHESGKKLFFTGGTYLRLIHDLKRFSEDLDFNTAEIKKEEFEVLIHALQTELKRLNIRCEVKFRHWGQIFAASLVFSEIEERYGVISKFSRKAGIVIKVETNRPAWLIKKETAVISGYGEIFPCLCTDKGSLFADKIDALMKKKRGRHLYDIIFMLSNRFPVNNAVSSSLDLGDAPLKILLDGVMRFSRAELKRQAESLKPFLFEESESDWIIEAHQIVPSLIEKYK